MSFWGQSIQSGTASTSQTLRDYKHASKTFVSNGYALAPKFKFLFHVFFDINPQAYNVSQEFGLAVKSVQLPSYTFSTETLNQYNRKRIVQTKIRYSPVNIEFHDDNSNMMTHLWQAYYNYYYKDGTNFGQVLNSGVRGGINNRQGTPVEVPDASYNKRTQYDDGAAKNSSWNWGYIGEGNGSSTRKVPFFKNITIFGFNRHTFTSHTLINPVLTSFGHDTYNYSDGGGTMQMRMDIDYETVVYNEGAMDGRTPGNIVQGFGSQQHYDLKTSPITPTNNNSYVPGEGGYKPASGGYVAPQRKSNPIDNSGQ